MSPEVHQYLRQVDKWRQAEGLSQRDLADRSGLSLRTVQRLMSGGPAPEPSVRVLKALAEALGQRVRILLVPPKD